MAGITGYSIENGKSLCHFDGPPTPEQAYWLPNHTYPGMDDDWSPAGLGIYLVLFKVALVAAVPLGVLYLLIKAGIV